MKKALLFLTLVMSASIAEARDNRLLRCSVTAARTDPGKGGPVLVADVKRALTPIDLNAVLWTDVYSLRKVVLEGLFARRTETNTLEVTARFVNCTKKPVTIQVRSNFMDLAQAPTEPASVWKTIFLSPRSTSVYQEKSIGTDNVANYLIELRSNAQ